MRTKVLLGIGLAFSLAAMPAVATAAPIRIVSGLQGWVNSVGADNGSYSGNNTFTGIEHGARYNSWASFGLSSLLTQSPRGLCSWRWLAGLRMRPSCIRWTSMTSVPRPTAT